MSTLTRCDWCRGNMAQPGDPAHRPNALHHDLALGRTLDLCPTCVGEAVHYFAKSLPDWKLAVEAERREDEALS